MLAELKRRRPGATPGSVQAEEEEGPLGPLNCLVPNIRVVYAYENRIERVGPLGEKLEQLYLQSNELGEMRSWCGDFPRLKVLQLDRNRLRNLEGLERSQALEDLSLAHQRLPQGVPCLGFDPMAVRALGRSLERLDVSGNRLWDLSPLAPLQALRCLRAAENQLKGIEGLEVMLEYCRELRTLDVRGNPFENPKIRDEIVLKTAGPLSELDGKDVTDKEKEFIRQMAQRKAKAGRVALKERAGG